MADDRDGSGGWSLRAGHPDDREAVRAIWAETFGAADEAERWLDLVWSDAPAVAPVVEADGEVIGFAVVAVLTEGGVRSYIRGHDLAEELPDRVSVIHMLGVESAWRSSEVGTALVGQSLEWAAARTDRMVVTIWERDDHVDSTGVAEKFGFERVDTLPHFYESRTDCPDCGGNCTCPAALYVRDLDD